jgi:hypothetical protein
MSNQRKIHLEVDGVVLCGSGACLPSLSSDPEAEGTVCQKCQRVLERLVRPLLKQPAPFLDDCCGATAT